MRKSQGFPQSRQVRKKSSLKKIFFAGLFFCLFAGLVYFLIWSPFLWIERVEFRDSPSDSEGLSLIVQKKLEEKLWQFIPQESIVLAPTDKIREDILERFPEIKSAAIYKELPNILRVEIEEREKVGIWCKVEYEAVEIATTTEESLIESDIELKREVKECFYIDKEGVIYRESPLISGSLVLNIYSAKNQSADIRSKVISSEIIDFILALENGLPKIKTTQESYLKAVDFEVVGIEDLRVRTFNGWQIYFNPGYSVESQLRALEMVLAREIKEDVDSLEYIDLGIEGRVYYK